MTTRAYEEDMPLTGFGMHTVPPAGGTFMSNKHLDFLVPLAGVTIPVLIEALAKARQYRRQGFDAESQIEAILQRLETEMPPIAERARADEKEMADGL